MRPRGHDPKPGVEWAGKRVSSNLEGSAGHDPQLGARRTPLSIEDKYDVTITVDAVGAWNGYKTVASLIELGHSLGLEGRGSGT